MDYLSLFVCCVCAVSVSELLITPITNLHSYPSSLETNDDDDDQYEMVALLNNASYNASILKHELILFQSRWSKNRPFYI